MQKSTTIFSDDEKKDKKPSLLSNNEKIILSRDDYREIIKLAYKEGREDASKESFHKITQPETSWQAEIQQEGKKEAIRSAAQKKETNKQRFETIAARHEIELMHVSSLFPFTLFPDTFIIDTTKVSIAKRQLYATEYITTIPLKDLADVNVQTALFLGSLSLKYTPHTANMNKPLEVNIFNLKRRDAIKAKNILKGVLVAKAEDIDIAMLAPEDVVDILQKFGNSSGVI